jgi:FtsH-binding integral membrane protein
VHAAFRGLPTYLSQGHHQMNEAGFQASTPYARFGSIAIDAPVDARRTFIRKTYTHLAAAIYAFVALEWLFMSLGWDDAAVRLLGNTPMAWLLVLGGFFVVSLVANRWALSDTSPGMQYAGLFLYVLAEAILFLPLLALAKLQTAEVPGFGDVNIIGAAGVTTLVIFGGLTAVVLVTKKDFSFLGSFLRLAMFAALALIVLSMFGFGLNLGIWFVWAMVVLASGYILYYTSNVLHHYRTDQYVAAALALFASVALLFWYVLQLFMSRD